MWFAYHQKKSSFHSLTKIFWICETRSQPRIPYSFLSLKEDAGLAPLVLSFQKKQHICTSKVGVLILEGSPPGHDSPLSRPKGNSRGHGDFPEQEEGTAKLGGPPFVSSGDLQMPIPVVSKLLRLDNTKLAGLLWPTWASPYGLTGPRASHHIMAVQGCYGGRS